MGWKTSRISKEKKIRIGKEGEVKTRKIEEKTEGKRIILEETGRKKEKIRRKEEKRIIVQG